MAEDEFFKRIAETLVMDEPVSNRPAGTAERHRTRAKQPVITNETSGEEPEPRGHSAELAKAQRRWSRARLLVISLASIAGLVLVVGATLALDGGGATPSVRERSPVMRFGPPRAPRPRRLDQAPHNAHPESGERRARRAKSVTTAGSNRQSTETSDLAGEVAVDSEPAPAGGSTREGFGFERGR
jgi:hypothetical protein